MKGTYHPGIEPADLLLIYDNMNVGTIITDAQGIVLWGNRYYSETAKFDIKEYFGKSIREISGRENVLITGKEKMIDIVLRTKSQHKEIVKYNTDDYVITTAIPIFGEHEDIRYILYIITNYSDTVRMERELASFHSKAEALESQLLQEQFDQLRGLGIIAEAREMRRIFQMGVRLASSHVSVMILGESGVGKDVLAKFIHQNGSRAGKNFIHVNLGAIPESLFESQLFGYEPGSFTGASKHGKTGLIQLADGGTLFLDEVGELPRDIQVKLLQVVQDKEVRRIGASRPVAVDVRIISATNKNLQKMVDEGTFRLDLFYRLNVIEIQVPPLRERREDIPLMAMHFLNGFNREYGTSKNFSPEVLNAFRRYFWPGNVRELRHVVESLVVTSNEEIVSENALPPDFFDAFHSRKTNLRFDKMGSGLKKAVADLEIQFIQKALKEHGTAVAAARHLDIDGSTLAKKRKKYGI
jgi:transcriptional regulator with PAS, ATPase and Fis domain